jgi:hypothetical protein
MVPYNKRHCNFFEFVMVVAAIIPGLVDHARVASMFRDLFNCLPEPQEDEGVYSYTLRCTGIAKGRASINRATDSIIVYASALPQERVQNLENLPSALMDSNFAEDENEKHAMRFYDCRQDYTDGVLSVVIFCSREGRVILSGARDLEQLHALAAKPLSIVERIVSNVLSLSPDKPSATLDLSATHDVSYRVARDGV